MFLVDESSRVLAGEHHAVKDAILEVVKQLDIGMTENLVALYGYDTRVHTKLTLQQETDKAQLLAAIQSQSLTDGIRFFRADTAEAVKFLVDTALKQQSGDRYIVCFRCVLSDFGRYCELSVCGVYFALCV